MLSGAGAFIKVNDMDRQKLKIPVAEFPHNAVTAHGQKVVLLGEAPNGRLVGYVIQSSNGDIISADWGDDCRFDKHSDQPSCLDLFEVDDADPFETKSGE